MKSISSKSTVLLMGVTQRLVMAMETLNAIEEKDYARIVKTALKHPQCLKGIKDNLDRGNIFMVLFFLREWIEAIQHSED
jgi:hypothetical protein